MNRVSDLQSLLSSSFTMETCVDDRQLHIQTFRNAKLILQKIERLEKKIHSFHQDDRRLFQEWEQTHFRDKHMQFVALQDRCYVLTHFHNRILATSRLLRVSISRAYQILKDEEEAFETGSDETRMILKKVWAERDQFADAEFAKAAEDAMENQSRKAIRKKGKNKVISLPKPPWEVVQEDLKIAYRKLVRKLHPDSSAVNSRSAAQMDWASQYWHRTQDAYQAKDLATLQKLCVMTWIQLQDFSSMSLAEIKESEIWFQQYLEYLHAQTEDFKSSRAWGFSRRKNHQSLINAMTKDFSKQMEPLYKRIQQLAIYHRTLEGGRKSLQDLQNLAGGPAHPRKRRPSVHVDQTSFLDFLS